MMFLPIPIQSRHLDSHIDDFHAPYWRRTAPAIPIFGKEIIIAKVDIT